MGGWEEGHDNKGGRVVQLGGGAADGVQWPRQWAKRLLPSWYRYQPPILATCAAANPDSTPSGTPDHSTYAAPDMGTPGASGARASVCPLRVAWARAVHGAGTSPPQQLLLLMMTPFTQESQLTGCLILKSRSAWLPASMTAVVAALLGGAVLHLCQQLQRPAQQLGKGHTPDLPLESRRARPAAAAPLVHWWYRQVRHKSPPTLSHTYPPHARRPTIVGPSIAVQQLPRTAWRAAWCLRALPPRRRCA